MKPSLRKDFIFLKKSIHFHCFFQVSNLTTPCFVSSRRSSLNEVEDLTFLASGSPWKPLQLSIRLSRLISENKFAIVLFQKS